MDSSWYSTAVIALCILLQILNCSGNLKKIGSLNVEPRIHNGTPAAASATRHQVSLRRKLKDRVLFGYGHICGGSLITNSIVLSAAHCFFKYDKSDETYEILPAKNYIIVMGNLDRFQITENTLIFNVTRIILNMKYSHTTYDADIALVLLRGTVPESHPVVKPIQLNRETLPGGTVCQVTGWGASFRGGGLSDVLMTVDVPIIPRDVCVRETEYEEENLLDGMMCAGYLEGGRDSCEGDSGGPLVCGKVLGGIVSWGWECGEPREPGVYTDVVFYLPWIEAGIKELHVSQPARAPTCYRGSFPLLSLLASLVILIKKLFM